MQTARARLFAEWEERLGNLSGKAIRGKDYRHKLLMARLRAEHAVRGNLGDGSSHSMKKGCK